MTSVNVAGAPRTVQEALHAHWKLFLFQGIVMVLLGILAVAAPAYASVAVDFYVGWLFLLSGLVGIVAMFSAGNVSSFLWTLVTRPCSRSPWGPCSCGNPPKGRSR